MLTDGLLASGSADKTILLWNVTSGEIEKKLVLSTTQFPPTIQIYSLAELPDKTLASCNNLPNIEIRLWNVTSGQQVRKLYGHEFPSKALVVLRDGRLASGSEDETIRIWDTSTGQSLITLTGQNSPITSLAVLPNGHLASGSDEGIRIWNID
jgi:WD40 repeat protein